MLYLSNKSFIQFRLILLILIIQAFGAHCVVCCRSEICLLRLPMKSPRCTKYTTPVPTFWEPRTTYGGMRECVRPACHSYCSTNHSNTTIYDMNHITAMKYEASKHQIIVLQAASSGKRAAAALSSACSKAFRRPRAVKLMLSPPRAWDYASGPHGRAPLRGC